MYLAQSFLHSLVAALIVDTSLIAWKIANPELRQRFRLLVVVLPIITFPLYQVISPDRGSPLFRLDAVFDITRWLNLEIWGAVPVGILFLLPWHSLQRYFCSRSCSPSFAMPPVRPAEALTLPVPMKDRRPRAPSRRSRAASPMCSSSTTRNASSFHPRERRRRYFSPRGSRRT